MPPKKSGKKPESPRAQAAPRASPKAKNTRQVMDHIIRTQTPTQARFSKTFPRVSGRHLSPVPKEPITHRVHHGSGMTTDGRYNITLTLVDLHSKDRQGNNVVNTIRSSEVSRAGLARAVQDIRSKELAKIGGPDPSKAAKITKRPAAAPRSRGGGARVPQTQMPAPKKPKK